VPNPRIPESASQDLKEVIKDLWRNIDLLLGVRNVDWHGRRVINAGDAVDPQDYVTKQQVEEGDVFERIVENIRNIENVPGGGGGGTGGGSDGSPGPPGPSTPVNPTPILDKAWPIGSIFISAVPTNPSALIGIGTWIPFAQGRVLVGIDSMDVDFDTVLEEIGSKTHVLVCDEIPTNCP
jgi:hypothetical protein